MNHRWAQKAGSFASLGKSLETHVPSPSTHVASLSKWQFANAQRIPHPCGWPAKRGWTVGLHQALSSRSCCWKQALWHAPKPNINSSNCFTPHLRHLLFQFSWCQHEIILLRSKAIDIPAIQSFAQWVCHNQAVPFYMSHLPPALNHCATLQPGHLRGWAYTVLQPPLVHPQVQRLPKNSGGTCDSRLPAHQQKLLMIYKPKAKTLSWKVMEKKEKSGCECVFQVEFTFSLNMHSFPCCFTNHGFGIYSKLTFVCDSGAQLLMRHTHCN